MTLVVNVVVSVSGGLVSSVFGGVDDGPQIVLSAADFGGSIYYESVDDNEIGRAHV